MSVVRGANHLCEPSAQWSILNNIIRKIAIFRHPRLFSILKVNQKVAHFRSLVQKSKNNFVQFLVQMRTRKFAFEINWPLAHTYIRLFLGIVSKSNFLFFLRYSIYIVNVVLENERDKRRLRKICIVHLFSNTLPILYTYYKTIILDDSEMNRFSHCTVESDRVFIISFLRRDSYLKWVGQKKIIVSSSSITITAA